MRVNQDIARRCLVREEADRLLQWFYGHARILPWREDKDPYRVWVSEIMLQQTRVEAVIPYFNRFMKELPTLKELACCEEGPLLKLWEGLGYYNRVRNMQKAAIQMMEVYEGNFPTTRSELMKLKGIGSYTAGAIASIAFNQQEPAVDGNVLRVWMRVHDDFDDIAKQTTKTKVEQEIMNWIPVDFPGDFTQAIMELGATVCVPKGEPKCPICPLVNFCKAKQNDHVNQIPVKTKAKPRKIQARTIIVVQKGNRVLLKKRENKGLLAGLYEFINEEGQLEEKEVIEKIKELGLNPIRISPMGEEKHIFSHIEWHMVGYLIKIDETQEDKGFLFADVDQLDKQYAIPSAYVAYRKQIRRKLE